jgi:diacylglycerol O-acyltransferase
MAVPMGPRSAGFMIADSWRTPMQVGILQLFREPEGAGADWVRELLESHLGVDEIAPLLAKRPHRSLATGGLWWWAEDDRFDISHHVRHRALPGPGRVRELLELCGRLHGTRLSLDRALWEFHVIEGLQDGRVATYAKVHRALVDGVSAMRVLHGVLSTDPDKRDMSAPWAKKATVRAVQPPAERSGNHADHRLGGGSASALGTALGLTAEAAGIPGALIRTLNRAIQNQTSTLALYAPETILNQRITAARRFAAQDWPIERMQAIGSATATTNHEVVLAMCSGALRQYLLGLDALPDTTLIAMVPLGLEAAEAHLAPDAGGSPIGGVMVRLGTDLPDPAARLQAIHRALQEGREAFSGMTPAQIRAMSAIGVTGSVLLPLLRLPRLARPPFNLVISHAPGPLAPLYMNGARLEGTYPLSIPRHGMALTITSTSYVDRVAFGVTGCRRTLPHLQRLLTHLDDELAALEKAAAG